MSPDQDFFPERRRTLRQRPLLAGTLLALLLAAGAVLAFRSFADRDSFGERVVALASETFSATVEMDRLAGYPVLILCLIPAGADARAIAIAGGIPASSLINIRVEPDQTGLLMHGEGQTTFGTIAASSWQHAAALSRCFGGGNLSLAFSSADPLRGGRVVEPLPLPAAAEGIEVQPLAPLPR